MLAAVRNTLQDLGWECDQGRRSEPHIPPNMAPPSLAGLMAAFERSSLCSQSFAFPTCLCSLAQRWRNVLLTVFPAPHPPPAQIISPRGKCNYSSRKSQGPAIPKERHTEVLYVPCSSHTLLPPASRSGHMPQPCSVHPTPVPQGSFLLELNPHLAACSLSALNTTLMDTRGLLIAHGKKWN